jgi:cobaltochelatase CobT
MDFARRLSSWFARLMTPFEELPQNIDPGPADKSYRIFSKDHDLVVGGNELAASIATFIEVLPSAHWGIADPALVGDARRAAESNLVAACGRLREKLTHEQIEDTAVALLLDHLGSMRAMRALIVADFAEVFADAFTELGISVEVLGFTTRSWRGGNSRKAWLARGRPKYPGRLCDLLHVVHRDANSTQGRPHRFPAMRQAALYKENIDGEALLWARDRLMARHQRVKILIVVSDGAPVDDATLSTNWNYILFDHIKEVIAEIETNGGIALCGIGIDHEIGGFYATSVAAKPCDMLGNVAPAFVEQVLLTAQQRRR